MEHGLFAMKLVQESTCYIFPHLLCHVRRHFPRFVDMAGRHLGQLWNPLSKVIALGIIILRLPAGVEGIFGCQNVVANQVVERLRRVQYLLALSGRRDTQEQQSALRDVEGIDPATCNAGTDRSRLKPRHGVTTDYTRPRLVGKGQESGAGAAPTCHAGRCYPVAPVGADIVVYQLAFKPVGALHAAKTAHSA